MKRPLCFGLACALALSACKSDDKPTAPVTPVGDSGVPEDLDAARNEDDAGEAEDAAAALLARRECEKLEPNGADDEVPVEFRTSGISVPEDLIATRQVTTWFGGCDDPQLLIKLSDGKCVEGKGHELQIYISTKAVIENRIVTGENRLVAEPDSLGIRVRYKRPDDLDPNGLWGTCKDVNGFFVLPKELEFKKRSELYGFFQMTLSHCDAPIEAPNDGADAGTDAGAGAGKPADFAPIAVNGNFRVQLKRSLADYCPIPNTP